VKVSVLFIGKPRDRHANAIAEEYLKRTGRYAKCEMREIDPRRSDPWKEAPGAIVILLDPAAKPMTSARFADLVRSRELAGRPVAFVVGGADGLPPEWRERADTLLSLSAMTLPHELARAVLAEQIYRAFATLRGHPYPR
jgi:23S rRNA (pseudouridine1915-N3)-methyltransferase